MKLDKLTAKLIECLKKKEIFHYHGDKYNVEVVDKEYSSDENTIKVVFKETE